MEDICIMGQMTKEDFESKIKEIVVSSVQPILAEQGKTLDTIKGDIDAQIKTLSDGLAANRPQFEVGEDRRALDPKGGFKCISQFAREIYLATKTGFRTIPKALGEWEAISKAADATTLREDDGEYGGFLIPEEFRNDLWLAVEQANPVLPLCMQVPMAVNTVKIPYVNGFDESGGLVYGGIEWKWLDELTSKTATRPKFGRITLSLKKCAGLAYASDEILEDSPMSMENILKKGFSDGLNFQLMKVILRGTGAGQPLGILNAPCLVSVAAEGGQAVNTILWENIIKMYARHSSAASAVWIANEDCLPQLASMSLAVGTGGVPVWMPANGAAGKPYDTLMGKPLIWSKHCSTVGDVGDIMLCDFSQYLVGTKSGQGATGRFDTSIHLKFDADQTAFRFVFRIDGQPWWVSALTPPQSASTVSPFVAIATR